MPFKIDSVVKQTQQGKLYAGYLQGKQGKDKEIGWTRKSQENVKEFNQGAFLVSNINSPYAA